MVKWLLLYIFETGSPAAQLGLWTSYVAEDGLIFTFLLLLPLLPKDWKFRHVSPCSACESLILELHVSTILGKQTLYQLSSISSFSRSFISLKFCLEYFISFYVCAAFVLSVHACYPTFQNVLNIPGLKIF